jgi:SAM-dependent methyltransferase
MRASSGASAGSAGAARTSGWVQRLRRDTSREVVVLVLRTMEPPARSYGKVFDQIAEQYDRHRPTYPDALIDRACEVAGLAPGARVLEIGCGTGQLTRSLLARGLSVTAVEPGEQLLARARERLPSAAQVQFVHARLEEAGLPRAHFRAAFAASSIHWVDPEVSWRTIADALLDGGTIALVSYFGLEDPRSADDQQALHASLTKIAPELAAEWPSYRDLDGTLAGVRERRENVSEVWAWLGRYDVARGYVRELFEPAAIDAVPVLVEHTADALNAVLGTMSFWARLSPGQRDALVAENHALEQRLGRPIRASTAACLVMAQRKRRS